MTFVFNETETGISVTDGKNFTWAELIERDKSPIIMSGINTRINNYYLPQDSEDDLKNMKVNMAFLKDQRIIAIFKNGFIKTISNSGMIRYYQCI